MFRKITSNRDPQATIGSELKKEFGPYLDKLSGKVKLALQRYPRQLFVLMVMSMLGSGILAFSVMRVKQPSKMPLGIPAGQGIGDGLSQIIRTGRALQEVLALHKGIDTILHKRQLDQTDSLRLRQAFKQLDSIQHQINSTK